MKKKKKAVAMTEEERLAFEEQERLAEEEIRKKKEDVLSQFLKDKLMKEEKATKYNTSKLTVQWRNIMREAKAKELKKDIEILSQTFERVIDCKNAMIKTLSKDLLEAEEQYAMALRSHLQTVDYLLNLQKTQLETLTCEYSLLLATVCEEFDLERAVLIEQHHCEMNDIADILFAIDKFYQEQELEARVEFQSMDDEIKNKNLENRHALKVQLETKLEDLWQQFRHSLQTYNETNTEQRGVFEALKLKDDKSSKEIELHMRKLQRISEQIAMLRAKLSSNAQEYEEKRHAVKDEEDDEEFAKQEKMKMIGHFYEMKSAMNQLRHHKREKLTKLTIESNAAIKVIKEQKEKGALILRLAEMCRKLETEEEKVLPFYVSSLTHEDELDVRAAMMEPASHPLVDIMHQWSGLENFWSRYNKVLLEKLSLEMEKQTLSHQNHHIRMQLKQYLDGISVNQDVISNVNPLLVVSNIENMNAKTKTSMTNYCTSGATLAPKTVVEAAHVVKNILE